MALSDPEGVVLAANAAYHALYGYTPAEVVGKNFAIIFPEQSRAFAQAGYRAMFRGPAHPEAIQAKVRRRDGTERLVESRVSFIEEAGRRVALLSIIRDVTEEIMGRIYAAHAEDVQRASDMGFLL